MPCRATGTAYFRSPKEAWGKRLYLPLFLRRFESGWYVRTGHKSYPDLFGKRIVAIEKTPLPEVVRRLEPYIGSRNRMRVLDVANQLMRLPQVLHAIGVIERLTPTVSLTAVDENGHEVSVEVTALPDWINDDFHDADVSVPTPKPRYRTFDDIIERFTQLTLLPGIERTPMLSPDGKSIVFVSDRNGNLDVYLQRVGGGGPTAAG